jgi:hypothetical protein
MSAQGCFSHFELRRYAPVRELPAHKRQVYLVAVLMGADRANLRHNLARYNQSTLIILPGYYITRSLALAKISKSCPQPQ